MLQSGDHTFGVGPSCGVIIMSIWSIVSLNIMLCMTVYRNSLAEMILKVNSSVSNGHLLMYFLRDQFLRTV